MNHIGTLPSRESLIRDRQNVQDRVDVFWEKWASVCLHYLQKRHKQRIKQKNFQVGDLVLLIDHPTARAQYPLAHAVEVYPDGGGITRHVRLKTANRNKVNPHLSCEHMFLDRDSTKLALVEFPLVNPLLEHLYRNISGPSVDVGPELPRTSPSDIL